MKRRLGSAMMVVFIILAVGFPGGAVQAQQGGENPIQSLAISYGGRAAWNTYMIDKVVEPEPLHVGFYNSIALRPFDERPYISYYDATNKDLKLASRAGSGDGNCGPDLMWYCRTIDSGGDVGMYSSIAVWGTPLNWKIGISYYDATNDALKYAEWTSFPLIGGTWDIDTIAQGNVFVNRGLYTSLKFNSTGVPIIAYYSFSFIGDDSLTVAYYMGSGGNCGVGDAANQWHCSMVDSGNQVGKYPSLDLRYDDEIHVAYYDQGNGSLKTAYQNLMGLCGDGWICSTIDGAGATDTGLFPVLIAPKAPDPMVIRIAYYDKTNGKLRYTFTTNGGGNCTAAWQCDDIDTIGSGMNQVGIAMTLDEMGRPLIAYQNAEEELAPPRLMVARPAAATHELGLGNCGPTLSLFPTWQCNTVDVPSHTEVYVGDYISMVVYSNGLALIAYNESDDYSMNTGLKFAYQHRPLYLPLIIH